MSSFAYLTPRTPFADEVVEGVLGQSLFEWQDVELPGGPVLEKRGNYWWLLRGEDYIPLTLDTLPLPAFVEKLKEVL